MRCAASRNAPDRWPALKRWNSDRAFSVSGRRSAVARRIMMVPKNAAKMVVRSRAGTIAPHASNDTASATVIAARIEHRISV